MEALWREELSAIADALCAKIARLRAAQRLSRGDRLKRINPALKDSVRRLLRAAGMSRKLHGLAFLPTQAIEMESDQADSGSATEDASGELLTIIPFLEATFTRKRCAKFLLDFEPASADAILTLRGRSGGAAPSTPISKTTRSLASPAAWPVQGRAGSGIVHILLVDQKSGAQQARYSTRISAVRPIEGILTYLSKCIILQNETQGIELYFSIGSSAGEDRDATIYHLDRALTESIEQMISEYITSFWKGKEPSHRHIRVTCVAAFKPRKRLTGTFTVDSKPVFRLSFPAEPSSCIDLRDCRQLIEDAVRESTLESAAERTVSRYFSMAISDGKWNFMRRGLAIPVGDEPGQSALELAIETGSARMLSHSMEEALKFAVSIVH